MFVQSCFTLWLKIGGLNTDLNVSSVSIQIKIEVVFIFEIVDDCFQLRE